MVTMLNFVSRLYSVCSSMSGRCRECAMENSCEQRLKELQVLAVTFDSSQRSHYDQESKQLAERVKGDAQGMLDRISLRISAPLKRKKNYKRLCDPLPEHYASVVIERIKEKNDYPCRLSFKQASVRMIGRLLNVEHPVALSYNSATKRLLITFVALGEYRYKAKRYQESRDSSTYYDQASINCRKWFKKNVSVRNQLARVGRKAFLLKQTSRNSFSALLE